jgi:hypothetical protein
MATKDRFDNTGYKKKRIVDTAILLKWSFDSVQDTRLIYELKWTAQLLVFTNTDGIVNQLVR